LIVVDASAVVEVLVGTGARAGRIREKISIPGQSLHAPYLMDLEVLHTLRRHAMHGTLSRRRSDEALEDLTNIVFERYPHTPFLERVWALKDNLTAYDAAYVALAEALSAPLVTTDARLARAPGIRAEVEVYG
jgi:predicted nucleic acid-binding protein